MFANTRYFLPTFTPKKYRRGNRRAKPALPHHSLRTHLGIATIIHQPPLDHHRRRRRRYSTTTYITNIQHHTATATAAQLQVPTPTPTQPQTSSPLPTPSPRHKQKPKPRTTQRCPPAKNGGCSFTARSTRSSTKLLVLLMGIERTVLSFFNRYLSGAREGLLATLGTSEK